MIDIHRSNFHKIWKSDVFHLWIRFLFYFRLTYDHYHKYCYWSKSNGQTIMVVIANTAERSLSTSSDVECYDQDNGCPASMIPHCPIRPSYRGFASHALGYGSITQNKTGPTKYKLIPQGPSTITQLMVIQRSGLEKKIRHMAHTCYTRSGDGLKLGMYPVRIQYNIRHHITIHTMKMLIRNITSTDAHVT